MKLSEAQSLYWLANQQRLSKTTQSNYRYLFNRLTDYLEDPEIVDISTNDIRRFLLHIAESFDVSNRTLASYWVILSALWTWAESELKIEHVIRGKIVRPHYADVPQEPFTQDEIKALLKSTKYTAEWTTKKGTRLRSKRPTALRDTAILLMLLDTGIRVSELCSLTIGNYDHEQKKITILRGKGGKSRVVYVGQRTQVAIWRHLAAANYTQNTDPLFATQSGTALNRDNLRHTLQRIGKLAGVSNVYPHRFRHTFAITFLRNGGNVFVLQRILGHSTLESTMRYVKLANIDLAEAQRQASPADNWKL